MLNLRTLNSFLLVFLCSLATGNPQMYDRYNYNGAEVHRWQDFDPVFNFQSHRVNPQHKVHASFPVVPPVMPHQPQSFDYPVFDSKDYDYTHGVRPIPSKPKTKEVVNITAERMGGFGGTGDTHGYGAYEYKRSDNSLYATPFTDFFRLPKAKRNFFDYYPLQGV